jgi:hypothetical protein
MGKMQVRPKNEVIANRNAQIQRHAPLSIFLLPSPPWLPQYQDNDNNNDNHHGTESSHILHGIL